jgi:hypothetical protein
VTGDDYSMVVQKILDALEEVELPVEQELEILRDAVAIVLSTGEVPVSVFTESLEERMGDVVCCEAMLFTSEVGEA